MKIGDLVWCQNGVKRNMGIIVSRDPDYPNYDGHRIPSLQLEDYVWVTLVEGSSLGQDKWTKIKNLELISESG